MNVAVGLLVNLVFMTTSDGTSYPLDYLTMFAGGVNRCTSLMGAKCTAKSKCVGKWSIIGRLDCPNSQLCCAREFICKYAILGSCRKPCKSKEAMYESTDCPQRRPVCCKRVSKCKELRGSCCKECRVTQKMDTESSIGRRDCPGNQKCCTPLMQ